MKPSVVKTEEGVKNVVFVSSRAKREILGGDHV